jgi:N-acetylmuramoyl-L-alanine amidase
MRPITKIIIHCTATREGVAVSVDDIRTWHKERGFSDIGYHYVIDINGVLHKGRDEQKAGSHCVGHNAKSIGVVYVGGFDKRLRPKDTRTSAQSATLTRLLKELKTKYPEATIHGHNEFANKACPCFNVSEYIKTEKL